MSTTQTPKSANTVPITFVDSVSDKIKPSGAIAPASYDAQGNLIGYVHSIETGAAVDGPGVRFALFTSGCQFRCLYCHNPDTWKLHNGTVRTVDEMVAEIGKYAGFLKFAGGVTFSGGEPLMQPHFVGAIIQKIKEKYNLHVALDTQGFLASHLDDDWFDPVDLIMLDIKHIDPAKYLRLTSQELQPTLDFAERMIRLKKNMWIRYVLVPGWTDDITDVENHANYVKKLVDLSVEVAGKNLIERVEVLPFHQMGVSKWQELDMPYELHDTPAPSEELINRVKEQYRSKGLTVL